MAQIVWGEPALRDLDDIAEYIVLDKESAAKILVDRVFSRVEQLQEFPESWRKPPELLQNSRYFEVIVGPCRILYRFDGTKVFVVKDFYGSLFSMIVKQSEISQNVVAD